MPTVAVNFGFTDGVRPEMVGVGEAERSEVLWILASSSELEYTAARCSGKKEVRLGVLWISTSPFDPECATNVGSEGVGSGDAEEEELSEELCRLTSLLDLGSFVNVISERTKSGEDLTRFGEFCAQAVSLNLGCATGVDSGRACSERMRSGGEYDR